MNKAKAINYIKFDLWEMTKKDEMSWQQLSIRDILLINIMK